MRRKVVEPAPNGGLREVWVDLGPAKALIGHGSATSLVVNASTSLANAVVGEGRRIPARGTGS